MGVRKTRINQHKRWTKTINEAKDKMASKILAQCNKSIRVMKKDPSLIRKEFSKMTDIVRNYIWKSLEETYSLSSKMVKEIYDLSSQKIDLKNLTYDKDNQTLDERLTKYFSEILDYLLENKENSNWDLVKRNLQVRLLLILDTETQTVKTKVINRKVEAHCEFAEVLPGGCGDDCSGSGGIYPIDELDLPPFHPNCQCEVIYYEELTDSEEEIEDLELEVEKVYFE